MTNDQLLSVGLLDELESRWSAAGAPISRCLRPGLSDADMDELVAPYGLRLSDEARTWWGWHDGTSSETVADPSERAIGPNLFDYLPLAGALDLFKLQSSLAPRVAAAVADVPSQSDPAFWWDPQWLPFTRLIYGGAVAIDLRVDQGEPSPIHVVNWESTAFREPSSPSFAQMVRWWIEAIDTAYWTFDQAKALWTYPPGAHEGPGGMLT